MSINTSRTSENGLITIDHDRCNACGLCVGVCKDFSLIIENGTLRVSDHPAFGCIGCGHCTAVCPRNAIMVTGRTIKESDYQPVKPHGVSEEALYNLLLNRRSIRDFLDKPVPGELVDKVLDMASTAPMGIPPSDVGVLMFDGKEKVRQFSFDFMSELANMQWIVNPLVLQLMRLFMKKVDYSMMKEFVRPLILLMVNARKENKNYLLYDAPLAMMFYGKTMSDPADPYIAATYATIAAEASDLGSCMIGSIGPFLKYTRKSFKQKYKMTPVMHHAIFVIMGYPRYKFFKTVKRTFAEIQKV